MISYLDIVPGLRFKAKGSASRIYGVASISRGVVKLKSVDGKELDTTCTSLVELSKNGDIVVEKEENVSC